MEMFKVIKVDNFDRESVSDVLVKENISEAEAIKIVEDSNRNCSDTSEWFYRCVKQDYKLWDASELY